MFRPRPCVHRFTAPPTEPPQEIANKGFYDIKKWFARLGAKHVGQEGADGDGKKAAEAVFVSDELAKLLEDHRLSSHGPGES